MEEIKVGEYVRYADGCICKITEDFKDYTLETATIINHSPNIIDLIEVGDYVNGERVVNINGNLYVRNEGMLEYIQIKNIVTKEMMESIKYEVE